MGWTGHERVVVPCCAAERFIRTDSLSFSLRTSLFPPLRSPTIAPPPPPYTPISLLLFLSHSLPFRWTSLLSRTRRAAFRPSSAGVERAVVFARRPAFDVASRRWRESRARQRSQRRLRRVSGAEHIGGRTVTEQAVRSTHVADRADEADSTAVRLTAELRASCRSSSCRTTLVGFCCSGWLASWLGFVQKRTTCC